VAEYGQAVPFTAGIDTDGTIYEIGLDRRCKAVGIDLERATELSRDIEQLKEITEDYYNKLVELGAIVPPKTAEEIAREQAAEQAEINKELIATLREMRLELNELKAGADNGSVRCGGELYKEESGDASEFRAGTFGSDSENDKPKPAKSKTGAGKG